MNLKDAIQWAKDASDREVESLCDDGEFIADWNEKTLTARVYHEGGGTQSTYQVIEMAPHESLNNPEAKYAIKMMLTADDPQEIVYYIDGYFLEV